MTPAEKNAAASDAPRPFPLGERVLLLSAPTLADLAGIATEGRRLRQPETPLSRIVNDPAFGKLPLAAQVECAREAARIQAPGETSLTGGDLAEELGRPVLLSFAVWVLAKKHQPQLRLEEVRPCITDDNAGEVFVEFVRASGILELGKNSVGASG